VAFKSTWSHFLHDTLGINLPQRSSSALDYFPNSRQATTYCCLYKCQADLPTPALEVAKANRSSSSTFSKRGSALQRRQPQVPIIESAEPSKALKALSCLLSNLSLEAHEMQPTSGSGISTDEAKFSCFPNLPVELRLKIWSFAAIKTPRIVTGLHFRQGDQAFKSATPNPTVMRVCRESREAGSKVFSLLLEAKPKSIPSARLYVNPDSDTVYYCDMSTPRYGGTCRDYFLETLAALVSSEKTNEIQHVMYELNPTAMRQEEQYRGSIEEPEDIEFFIRSYGKLKSLTLIVNDAQYKWEGNKYLAIKNPNEFGASIRDQVSNPFLILRQIDFTLQRLNAKFSNWRRPALKIMDLKNNLEGTFEDIIRQGLVLESPV